MGMVYLYLGATLRLLATLPAMVSPKPSAMVSAKGVGCGDGVGDGIGIDPLGSIEIVHTLLLSI